MAAGTTVAGSHLSRRWAPSNVTNATGDSCRLQRHRTALSGARNSGRDFPLRPSLEARARCGTAATAGLGLFPNARAAGRAEGPPRSVDAAARRGRTERCVPADGRRRGSAGRRAAPRRAPSLVPAPLRAAPAARVPRQRRARRSAPGATAAPFLRRGPTRPSVLKRKSEQTASAAPAPTYQAARVPSAVVTPSPSGRQPGAASVPRGRAAGGAAVPAARPPHPSAARGSPARLHLHPRRQPKKKKKTSPVAHPKPVSGTALACKESPRRGLAVTPLERGRSSAFRSTRGGVTPVGCSGAALLNHDGQIA